MDVLKLFSTGSATADGVASLDVPQDGFVVAVHLDLSITSANALDDGVAAEVSFASSSGFGVNDTRASIVGARTYQGFLTTGGGPTQKTVVISGLAIEAAAGERLYMHIQTAGGVTYYATCWLFFMPTGSARASQRRRL